MADASNITVAIEQAIHSSLAETLQKIENQFGLRVQSISAQWGDYSQVAHAIYRLDRLTVTTESNPEHMREGK